MFIHTFELSHEETSHRSRRTRVAGGAYFYFIRPPTELVLTGVVTPMTSWSDADAGRLEQLLSPKAMS